MAIRFPISSGNWSNTAIWSGSLTPTTADDVYANGFIVNIDQNVTVISIRNTASGSAVAGGSFDLSGSVTLTCTDPTNGIVAGTSTVLTFNANSPSVSNIVANVYASSTSGVRSIYKWGNGTLNFTGILDGDTNNALTTNTGSRVLNIVGTVRKTGGNISTNPVLIVSSGSIVNITGNVLGGPSAGGSTKRTFSTGGSCTINITGNVDGSNLDQANSYTFSPTTSDVVTITGTVTGTLSVGPSLNCFTVYNTAANTLNVVGPIVAGFSGAGVYSTSTSAINIFTGPFIYSSYGVVPYYVYRMHLQPILNNYIQFRDSSTSGSVSPGPTASIARFVSADTVISDQPIPANVRSGVVYGSGAYTGTMIVPNSANVRLGIPVDNTTGSAVLSVQDIWNYPIQNMTSSNSVGNLLKNVSTVGITGDQIAAFVV